jgi:hypothetical protein
MARHATVDLCLVFRTPPRPPVPDRLPASQMDRLRSMLHSVGIELHTGSAVEDKLVELRSLYEPFLNALAEFLLIPLPPIVSDQVTVDNWQTTAWTRRSPGIGGLRLEIAGDDHFD